MASQAQNILLFNNFRYSGWQQALQSPETVARRELGKFLETRAFKVGLKNRVAIGMASRLAKQAVADLLALVDERDAEDVQPGTKEAIAESLKFR